MNTQIKETKEYKELESKLDEIVQVLTVTKLDKSAIERLKEATNNKEEYLATKSIKKKINKLMKANPRAKQLNKQIDELKNQFEKNLNETVKSIKK